MWPVRCEWKKILTFHISTCPFKDTCLSNKSAHGVVVHSTTIPETRYKYESPSINEITRLVKLGMVGCGGITWQLCIASNPLLSRLPRWSCKRNWRSVAVRHKRHAGKMQRLSLWTEWCRGVWQPFRPSAPFCVFFPWQRTAEWKGRVHKLSRGLQRWRLLLERHGL